MSDVGVGEGGLKLLNVEDYHQLLIETLDSVQTW